MTGLVRKALTLAAGLTVVASVAIAGVPDPRNSVVEQTGNPIVGNASGNVYSTSIPGDIPGFEVTVRDVNSAPLANRTVALDFSATTVKVYSAQNAGTTVNCPAKTISKLTNVSGVAIFGARVGSFVNTNGVEVSADGVVLANVKSRSTDIDGSGATTNAADLNLFRVQLFAPQPAAAQTDYTIDTLTNSADLNIFRSELFTAVVGAYCP
jgi:hypothetical protein